MVKLDYDALGGYLGNVAGYAATSPQVTGHPLNPDSAASKRYLGYVHGIENAFTSALRLRRLLTGTPARATSGPTRSPASPSSATTS